MKFAYEDLSPTQFENLVILICQKLFGISVQGFSEGPDGGRDAKFIGTAETFPSRAEPWIGTTIIQAKHTNGYNKSFAESDFYSNSSNSTIIANEIPRIIKLRKNKELDNYIFFANRKLSGNSESEISNHISNKCGIPRPSIYLCGVEQLENWLKTYPDIPERADLDPIDSPLIVSPDDLAEVIQALIQQKDTITEVINNPPVPRISYEEKNRINNMTPIYAKAQRKKYLKETTQIHSFLSDPVNLRLLDLYQSAVDEFQLKIIAHRKDYQTFDKVMDYLADLLFNRDPILSKHKKLTRTILFYMYWYCDIGEVEDAETN